MLLKPYRVIDLTQERGNLAGQILADLGADVIQVEPPGGASGRRLAPFYQDKQDNEHSLYWWGYTRGKRSLELDLKTERRTFLELVKSADFLIESEPVGSLDAIGCGYSDLAQENSALIYVSITPFGLSGPKAHWAA
ncbi:MAG: CoA transferase, partial [Pseudomonadales bacterium]|nr:CoA transferase [Pseudomonadales bacterium]